MTFRDRHIATVRLALYHAACVIERVAAGDAAGAALHAAAAAKYGAAGIMEAALLKSAPIAAHFPFGTPLAAHELECLATFDEAMRADVN